MAGHEVDPPDDKRCIDCIAPLSDEESEMYGNRCETCEQVWFRTIMDAAANCWDADEGKRLAAR